MQSISSGAMIATVESAGKPTFFTFINIQLCICVRRRQTNSTLSAVIEIHGEADFRHLSTLMTQRMAFCGLLNKRVVRDGRLRECIYR